MDKRRGWFHEGARYYRQTVARFRYFEQFECDEGMYPCPLCLRTFPLNSLENGDLTVEHVPPESLGGKPLLLTCARCNHTSGTAFDAAARNAERLRSHLAGTEDNLANATFSLNDTLVNGEILIAGERQSSRSEDFEVSVEAQSGLGIYFNTVRRINNPANVARFDEAWENAANKRLTLSFELKAQAPPHRAAASWIRTAYLAAFARFGWFYALHPTFESLRYQLLRGREVELPELYRYYDEADPTRREIIVADEDPNCPCFAVIYGQHSVFLPVVGSAISLEELADTIAEAESRGDTLSGYAQEWPSVPEYVFDRSLQEDANSGAPLT